MWKDFWKTFITLFTIAKESEQTRTDVKEIRRDLTNLTLVVQQLASEIRLNKQEDQNEREKIAIVLQSEREKMLMQLQIEVLKLQKSLPAPTSIEPPTSENETH